MKGRCAHVAYCTLVEHGTSSGAEATFRLMHRCSGALLLMLEAAVVVEDVSLHGAVGIGGKLLAALTSAAGTLRALDFTLDSLAEVRNAKSPATELLRACVRLDLLPNTCCCRQTSTLDVRSIEFWLCPCS